MNKVGEHITLDFLGVHEDHKPEFYENIFKKIAQAAKVEIVNISKYVFSSLLFVVNNDYFAEGDIQMIITRPSQGLRRSSWVWSI